MNAPLHLLHLQSAPEQRNGESVQLVARTDVQWGKPIFRAPAFPTSHQFNSELPFTVNFRAKIQRRA